jgi:membrane-bound ClpP family serine protease
LRKGLAARKRPALPTTPIAGELGLAETALAPGGAVRLRNELWSAVALRGTIARGAPVRVVGRHGLVVMVEATGDEGRKTKDEIMAVENPDSSFVLRPSSR